MRRKDVKWTLALAFAAVGVVLQLLASLNELPIRLFDYDTAEAWSGFLALSLLGDLAGAVALGAVLFLLVAAGEPLYRETYPGQPALSRILSLRGLRSKRFFRGLLLGYAMTAFFFAYQVVFYIVAERFGAWAPADVPHSSLLGTPLPWLGVLLMGFVPATTEEFSSRMFSIPFVRRFAPGWVAVVLPAFIWGFAHSTYPNQPFYIRGLEVGFAGVLIGVVFLKQGILPLLVWHFTVDAVYTALLLVRSTNPYFVISGAAASLVLLLPHGRLPRPVPEERRIRPRRRPLQRGRRIGPGAAARRRAGPGRVRPAARARPGPPRARRGALPRRPLPVARRSPARDALGRRALADRPRGGARRRGRVPEVAGPGSRGLPQGGHARDGAARPRGRRPRRARASSPTTRRTRPRAGSSSAAGRRS